MQYVHERLLDPRIISWPLDVNLLLLKVYAKAWS